VTLVDLLADLLADLADEEAELDRVLAERPEADWDRPTPAEGWAVRDVVGHLAQGEDLATLALTDQAAFGRHLAGLLADLDRVADDAHRAARQHDAAGLLAWWRRARGSTLDGLRGKDPTERVAWVTGRMSVASFATARLMETWAHGQDVADAFGIERAPSARLRHVADLGVRTRRFSFANRGLAAPDTDVRVELDAPGGGQWTWGPSDSSDRVRGRADEFCLVVTQRRPVSATGLDVHGDGALAWMRIAQAFAGPPTETHRRELRS